MEADAAVDLAYQVMNAAEMAYQQSYTDWMNAQSNYYQLQIIAEQMWWEYLYCNEMQMTATPPQSEVRRVELDQLRKRLLDDGIEGTKICKGLALSRDWCDRFQAQFPLIAKGIAAIQ